MSRLFIVACLGFVLVLAGAQAQDAGNRAATPVMLADINPGAPSSNPQFSSAQLNSINGVLVFTANDGVNGTELWKSDGTAAGTVLLKDINPGAPSSSPPPTFTPFNGSLFFAATDAATGRELWKTDGTAAGTVMVKDINPNAGAGSNPLILGTLNGVLLLSANDGATGAELWKSDGTAAGTVLVKDLNSGAGSSSPFGLNISNTDGTTNTTPSINAGFFYFSANTPATGTELFRTDGTDAGTTLVKDFTAGGNSIIFSSFRFNGKLVTPVLDPFFVATLWITDGTDAGSTLLRGGLTGFVFPVAFETVDAAGIVTFPSAVNGNFFFASGEAATGNELYKTDGTLAGTVVFDINPGAPSSFPGVMHPVGGKFVFSATSAASGGELFVTDLTPAGTSLLKDINPGAASSNAFFLPIDDGRLLANTSSLLNGAVFFAADDGVNGEEIWKSDGTAAGTVLVSDLNPGAPGSAPGTNFGFVKFGGKIIFDAITAATGTELFSLDLAGANPTPFKDINPGAGNSDPTSIRTFNGALYFTADNGTNGKELWKTDGTPAGTALFFEIEVGSTAPSVIISTASLDRQMLLAFISPNFGTEFLASDGTAAGSNIIDLNPGVPNGFVTFPAAIGSKLFFDGNTAAAGIELFSFNASEFAFPPVITSGLNRGGTVGAPFSYLFTATGATALPVTLSVSGLPPGLSFNPLAAVTVEPGITSASITGAPTTPGRYNVTLTASNAAGATSRTLVIIVPGAGTSGTGIDTDGDGIPDEVETFLKSNPNSPTSTPFGSTAVTPQTLTITKAQIVLVFSKDGGDSVSVSGTLPVPDGFNFGGQAVTFDVGGVLKTFTLNAKGKAKSSDKKDSVSINKPKGGVATFTAKFGKGDFADALNDENLVDQTVKNGTATVPFLTLFNSQLFHVDQTLTLNGTAGKMLKAAKPKK